MKTETIDFDTAGGASSAYLAMPDEVGEAAKAVVLIHEWWGLTDHIKDIAGRYADEGFICVAPDLYRGKVTTDKEEASQLMHDLQTEDGLDTIKNAVAKVREKYETENFGITGYCMGGTFAFQAICHLEEGIKAAAVFYGDVPDEDALKNLKGPVLFISGSKDQWINPEKVGEMKKTADKHSLPIESVQYEADHAFFNDTRPEVYDEEAANDAWQKVISFFNENLK